jgi:hypothetical protein
VNTMTIYSQHGPARKCIITPRGEYLSLEPVRCREHGAGPWCRKMGKGEHLPIRPVLEAVLEEVNRQLPRFPQGHRLAIRRFGYPEDHPGDPDALEVSLGGNDPRREGKRAGRMVQHVLREWFPRTLDLHGQVELAGRARRAAEADDRTFFQHAWKETTVTGATDAALAACNIAYTDREHVDQHPGRHARQQDFIGREIGRMAEEMLKVHREAGLELDLKSELRRLLEVGQ